MKSPFAIFRKHEKTLVVLLIGLSMVAFIFFDAISQAAQGGQIPRSIIIVFGAFLGAAILWIIGVQKNRGGDYAMTGGAIGAVLAVGVVLAMGWAGVGAVVDTNAGRLSDADLQEMITRRQLANQFSAYIAGRPLFGPTDEENIVYTWLLLQEAKRLGIVIGDEAVTNFIRRITQDKLSAEAYRELLRRMRVRESDLYDALRTELTALTVRQLEAPPDLRTPEEYWEYHRKLRVRQQLDATAIPVEPFTAYVEDPDETTLRAFFEEFANNLPNHDVEGNVVEGRPGFRLPRRVNVAAVVAEYETIEKLVPPVTDEEIQRYYEENKDTDPRLQIPIIPGEDEPQPTDETRPLDPQFSPDTEKKDGQPSADSPSDTRDGESDSAPDDAPNGSSKPAEPSTNPDAPKPDAPKKPAADRDAGTQPSKPAADEQSAVEPADSQRRRGPDPATSELNSDQPVGSAFVGTVPVALFTDDAASDGPAAETGDEVAQTDADATPKKQDTGNKKNEESAPKADLPILPPLPADGAASKKAGSEGEDSGGSAGGEATPADEKPKWKPKPLDDELKGIIRDQLLDERTREAMRERINRARALMTELGLRLQAPPSEEERITPEDVARSLKKFAEENGLKYFETGLVSREELENSTTYDIGRATEPVDNPFARNQAPRVIDILFEEQTGDESRLYTPFVADFQMDKRYAYWKTEDVPSHVPEFADVKDEVLRQWKLVQARPRAQKRAEELADAVRKALEEGKSMAEALAGQTVTGEPGSLELDVTTTPPFSWLETDEPTSFPNLLGGGPPRLSTIPNIEKPGEEFMRVVFDRLNNGEVGVAPNLEKTIFYVVRVHHRTPSTPEGVEELRRQLLSERTRLFGGGFFGGATPYDYLANRRISRVEQRWREELFARYEVVWNRPPR